MYQLAKMYSGLVIGLAALFISGSAFAHQTDQGDRHKHDHPPSEKYTPEIFIPDLETHHGETKPWTSAETLDDPSRFHFAIISDRTGGHRAGVFESAPERLNLLQPAFVLSVGDFIEGYTNNEDRIREEWAEIDKTVSPLEAPLFFTPGNHDISNSVQYDVWKERFGVDYYHFIYKDTLFLILNSEVFPAVTATTGAFIGTIDDPQSVFNAQLRYVEDVLRQHEDVRWTFIFMHNPVWKTADVAPAPGWAQLEALIGDRGHTLFAGHTHKYDHSMDPSHKHDRITLSTTGGGHSRLRGPDFGEFDHIAWVTMTEENPVIAQIELDGIMPADLNLKTVTPAAAALLDIVEVRPMMVEPGAFDHGTIVLDLKNPTVAPVGVRGVFPSSSNLSATPSAYAAVLAPGEERRVDITLKNNGDATTEQLAAIEGKWTVSTRSSEADGRRITVEDTTPLVPEHNYLLSQSESPISVDGRLRDWGGAEALRFSGVSERAHGDKHFGADDLDFRFDLRLRNDVLYIGAAVSDDVILTDARDDLVNQDFVQISLDLRSKEARERNIPTDLEFALLASDPELGFLTRNLTLRIAPYMEKDATLSLDLANRLLAQSWSNIAAKTSRTKTGYVIEAAIPLEGRLDALRADDGEEAKLRFNLMVHDFDAADDRTEHYWRSSRYHEAGHNRTGTFSIHP